MGFLKKNCTIIVFVSRGDWGLFVTYTGAGCHSIKNCKYAFKINLNSELRITYLLQCFFMNQYMYTNLSFLKCRRPVYVTLPQEREKIRFLLQSIKNCKFAFKINLNSELKITAK